MRMQIIAQLSSQPRFLSRLVILAILTPLFFSCQKSVTGKIDALPTAPVPQSINLTLSESRVVLLAGNESHSALSIYWDTSKGTLTRPVKFIVQAAVRGTNFDAPIDIASSVLPATTFSVIEFNTQMRRLLEPGKPAMVDLRIVGVYPDNKTVISNAMALEVTTYQPYKTFTAGQLFRIPGNYQSWKVSAAPELVAPDASGIYEGYIQFNCQSPQFLMVKGVNGWDALATYYDIGASKIGFNGLFFSLPSGPGVYRLKVNTNTNVWSYAKIEKWGLAGTAVNGKEATMVLKKADNTLSWRITASLQQGSFRIRANDNEAVRFGHNADQNVGVPDYNGVEIKVEKAGTYTVVLDLDSAGNYSYTLQRIS